MIAHGPGRDLTIVDGKTRTAGIPVGHEWESSSFVGGLSLETEDDVREAGDHLGALAVALVAASPAWVSASLQYLPCVRHGSVGGHGQATASAGRRAGALTAMHGAKT